MDSVPLVLITGQVASAFIGTDAFQEADITGITLPITKHNYLVKDIKELPGILAEAFYLASTGRRGPVLIDIPKMFLITRLSLTMTATVTFLATNQPMKGTPVRLAVRLKLFAMLNARLFSAVAD
jgi:acetolactate synthase I/II/III large subunit